MALFTSKKERRLWLWASLVAIAIVASLVINPFWPGILRGTNIDAGIFLFGMFLVFISILLHGLITKPRGLQPLMILAIAASYMMFFFRLTLAERSHLIEYSLLAILVHRALLERADQHQGFRRAAPVAFLITFTISLADEGIQLFLPERVFDTNDILFNAMVIFIAIAVRECLLWLRKRLKI
ncbi:MAG: VanZ family protein [Flavobacteriaceae bacterium]|nr:VanZ family protein [Flavobacteriaceae bacterium]